MVHYMNLQFYLLIDLLTTFLQFKTKLQFRNQKSFYLVLHLQPMAGLVQC